MDGVIYSEVYEESKVTQVFEGFIERLLPFCGKYPEPRSVIFMDSASFHFSPKIDEMLAQAGVVNELQAPYSPYLTAALTGQLDCLDATCKHLIPSNILPSRRIFTAYDRAFKCWAPLLRHKYLSYLCIRDNKNVVSVALVFPPQPRRTLNRAVETP